ncbi:hypothetical protein PoB_000777600 [Plakobranchus ocellatus]|uniref:Uncharacterized protein n=1 Tax=Plakobranchus ocellatus TaxID=259542 RepID=A0AAV3YDL5_9GAST|nr:hypothetical protein PoB_000777600 [Plakobranchus ocellatus]
MAEYLHPDLRPDDINIFHETKPPVDCLFADEKRIIKNISYCKTSDIQGVEQDEKLDIKNFPFNNRPVIENFVSNSEDPLDSKSFLLDIQPGIRAGDNLVFITVPYWQQ